ncbi:CrcB family protein [Kocuria sp. cx-455]|uniref:fluoride efflux transporter FluC n=1 Tax=Kocuria sp. cx-455 TaxID=2771377 RepID=UPI001688329C|nr:CrcB family protein [Kocuria sp. cx-455]MBD2764434.1 CrcB family protein [Kocuria sp. cx-455]
MTDTNPTTQLPTDPDTDAGQTTTGEPRPVHLRWTSLVAVFAGGSVGTGTREALTLAFPASGGIPWTIFAVNLCGAFLLGVLLDALARRGPDRGRRRLLRLLVGTGFMGGFTTYSAFAVNTACLLGAGEATAGIGHGLGTLLCGGLATWAGIVIATLAHRHRKGAAS